MSTGGHGLAGCEICHIYKCPKCGCPRCNPKPQETTEEEK